MSAWTIAAIALAPPLGLATWAAARGSSTERMVAVQLASSIAVLIAVTLCFVSGQASSIDLALGLALLSTPAALLFALFEERWL